MTDIKVFPILYKKNSKNAISTWQIRIEEDGEQYVVISTFGQEGGKQQIHKRIVEKGKANRSIIEQVNLEATSKWNEKTQRDTYTDIIPNSEMNATSLRAVVRPMLANSFDKELYTTKNKSRAFKLTFPIYLQRKFDGIRCMSYQELTSTPPSVRPLCERSSQLGETVDERQWVSSRECSRDLSRLHSGEKTLNNGIIMESRKGVVFNNFSSIGEELKKCFDRFPDVYFDGELYAKDIPFETISGLVRLHAKNTTKEQLDMIDKIEYHIYDVYDPMNQSWSFNERKDFLLRMSTICPLIKIKIVVTEIALDIIEVKHKHDLYVQEGFEGVILRESTGIYEQNKRSKYLQKYKEFMEEEFLITGFHDGEGHDKGMVIWECVTSTGKIFSAKPQGTFEERKRMFLIASTMVGKQLTVVFQELTIDGIPRFPVGKAIRDGY